MAPPIMWYASMPVLALLLTSRRWGLFWTLASAASIVVFAVANECGFQFPTELSPTGMRFLNYSGILGLVFCLHILLSVLINAEHRVRQALCESNERLSEVRTELDSIESTLRFPIADWAKLYQEELSLERQLERAAKSRGPRLF